MPTNQSGLLFALAYRMEKEVERNPDPDEQAKARAMADIFRIAGDDLRAGRETDLALAVLAQAKLGAHLVDGED